MRYRLGYSFTGILLLSIYGNPWFQVRFPSPRAALRLFCFPYAGGSATVFHDWPELLTRDVEVVALKYPGHVFRFGEPLITDCESMVEALMPNVVPCLDKPYAFFGHSIGGLLSYELALALQRGGHSVPTHHFISGKSPVHLPRRGNVLQNLPKDEFLRELSKLGGTPRELIDMPELLQVFLPILRADFALSENYSCTWQGMRLMTSVSLLYGHRDEYFSEGDVAAWAELIDGKVDSIGYDGGHFFIQSHKREVIDFVNDKLQALIRGRS